MNSFLLFLQDSNVVADSLAQALEGDSITLFDLLIEGGVLMIPIFLLFMMY